MVTLPFAVPAILTTRVQVPFAAMVPPVNETLPDPAVAVGVPLQVLVKPLGVAITTPAGKVSVKATPVNGMVFAAGLVNVNVRDVVPFNAMVPVPNAFAIVGGCIPTSTLAFETIPVPPSVEVMVTLLFFTPVVVPVTFTPTVQLPLAARVAELRETVPEPAMAVVVPLQVVVKPLGVATTNPAGRVSVNATPVSCTVLAVAFAMVKVREVDPFSAMLVAPNAFAIVGGATTVTVAVACAVAPLLSTTVSKTVVLPTEYGLGGVCVRVIVSPASGSDEPSSILAFAVPFGLAITVTLCAKAMGGWLTLARGV